VSTPEGFGIKGVTLTISGGSLANPITVLTGTFGYYRFDGLPTGLPYVVSIRAKKYAFAQPHRTINLVDDVTGFDFVSVR
jgi:hypothetical protein